VHRCQRSVHPKRTGQGCAGFRGEGIARQTIRHDRREVDVIEASARIRPGPPPRLKLAKPDLKTALEGLIDPLTRADPTSPLRWTCQSSARLAAALQNQGWSVSATIVRRLLHELGYSSQSALEIPEDGSHLQGNGQFEYINAKAASFLDSQQPVISVETTLGKWADHLSHGARQRKGSSAGGLVHDLPHVGSGKSVPHGAANNGRGGASVNVECGRDTPACAVASIRRWWRMMGRPAYPHARRVFITADACGSNGYRSHAWKLELQRMADDMGLRIHVSHFPPGLCRWNTIGHYLFCHVTQNWRGKRLRTLETIVELSGHAHRAAQLPVETVITSRKYPTGAAFSDPRMTQLDLHPSKFRGEWNYELRPRQSANPSGQHPEDHPEPSRKRMT
jgi:hypothetical protein